MEQNTAEEAFYNLDIPERWRYGKEGYVEGYKAGYTQCLKELIGEFEKRKNSLSYNANDEAYIGAMDEAITLLQNHIDDE